MAKCGKGHGNDFKDCFPLDFQCKQHCRHAGRSILDQIPHGLKCCQHGRVMKKSFEVTIIAILGERGGVLHEQAYNCSIYVYIHESTTLFPGSEVHMQSCFMGSWLAKFLTSVIKSELLPIYRLRSLCYIQWSSQGYTHNIFMNCAYDWHHSYLGNTFIVFMVCTFL